MKYFILFVAMLSTGCLGHRGAMVDGALVKSQEASLVSNTFYNYDAESMEQQNPISALYLYEEGVPDVDMLYYYPLHLKTERKIERTETPER